MYAKGLKQGDWFITPFFTWAITEDSNPDGDPVCYCLETGELHPVDVSGGVVKIKKPVFSGQGRWR